MKLKHYKNPKTFLQKVQPFLEENEALNNLMLGLAFSLNKPKAEARFNPNEALMILIENQEREVVFAALQTPPFNLIVSGKPAYLTKAIDTLVDYLESQKMNFPGVIGEKQAAAHFAQKWSELHNLKREIFMDLGVFQLDKVEELSPAKGNIRPMKAEDEDLVTEWTMDFGEHTDSNHTPETARKAAQRKLKDGLLRIWEVDGMPVSMASAIRPLRNGIGVSLVFTPPEHRKKGYARTCVAQLSQEMLDKGYKFCTLFTDLSNPTSNKIYQEIGYYKVGEFTNIAFK